MNQNIKFMKLTPGEKFALLRKLNGKSLEEVAAYMKLTLDAYLRLEDDFVYPSDQQIEKLGRFYGVSYEEVMAVGEEN
ncbi:transcriptional regulator with XRE-family HTH domain [Pedobacter africanus]|uniref:Transcriptional regulator with XRE-family HTH domain n=1 Tax=Pedobacter africanus TaxID=151894 RepID=A0ACC6KU80_9SPHI|nr:helix-turn-helix transcriptional regulator [Pedobacter africanus]MDR6782673.1 transcriptional regulator with XRE-family HTH domain [Pedobacter africanus]